MAQYTDPNPLTTANWPDRREPTHIAALLRRYHGVVVHHSTFETGAIESPTSGGHEDTFPIGQGSDSPDCPSPKGPLSIVVAGGGPAGSTAATLLARSGHNVTIVDRHEFPRDKVCGDAIVPTTSIELTRLGMADVFEHRRLLHGDNYVIPRREFDAALLNGARAAGATMLTGDMIDLHRTEAARWRLRYRTRCSRENIIEVDVVVGADGAQSTVRRATLGRRRSLEDHNHAFATRQYFSVANGPHELRTYPPLDDEELRAYGWAFPVTGRLLNIGYARFGMGSNRASLSRFNRFVQGLLEREGRHWKASPIGQPAAGLISFDFNADDDAEALLVGDAAGLSSPISGEGISFAVRSGSLAAETICAYARGLGQLSDYWRLVDSSMGEEIRRELDIITSSY